jgi:hypothetical protein
MASFEASVGRWILDGRRAAFTVDECWQEVASTRAVMSQGVAVLMLDINDLIDALQQLSSLGLVRYNWRQQRVEADLDYLARLLDG